MTKISYDQYLAFVRNPPHVKRFGQTFCNKFNITDSELYYCEDNSKSLDLIFEKYIGE